jgi:hypothetical protein
MDDVMVKRLSRKRQIIVHCCFFPLFPFFHASAGSATVNSPQITRIFVDTEKIVPD